MRLKEGQLQLVEIAASVPQGKQTVPRGEAHAGNVALSQSFSKVRATTLVVDAT